MDLRVFKIIERTKVEGPNERFCIWVQGCSKKCKGCWATNTWDDNKGEIISVNELFEKIKAQKGIEGVTFLGGEPFEQAQALALLAEKVKSINLSVVTFTGYFLEQLVEKNDANINKLIEMTDLLIDGPFEEKQFDLSRPWVGSSNKRYVFLSDRYSMEDIQGAKNKIEVRVDKNGFTFINGMGDFKKIQEIFLSSHTINMKQ